MQNPITAYRKELPSDCDVMRSLTPDGTLYIFHTGQHCPGYEILISNWCLKKTCAPISDSVKAYAHANKELRLRFGMKVFEERDRIQRLLANELQDPASFPAPPGAPGLRHQPDAEALERRLAAEKAVEEAIGRDQMRAENMKFVYPLWLLMLRDQVAYSITSRPWPSEKPPCYLLHFAQNGFASSNTIGLLAFGEENAEAWLVSRFSTCEVHHQQNHRNNLSTQPPDLMESMIKLFAKAVGQELSPEFALQVSANKGKEFKDTEEIRLGKVFHDAEDRLTFAGGQGDDLQEPKAAVHLFYELLRDFDPTYYTHSKEVDNESIRAQKQGKLAHAMLAFKPELARRYAALLRSISETETDLDRGLAFRQVIDRLGSADISSSEHLALPSPSAVPKRLRALRSAAGKKNAKVQNDADRAKIKKAVKQKLGKSGKDMSQHRAAREIAALCWFTADRDNLLDLSETYRLTADDVKRILGWKK